MLVRPVPSRRFYPRLSFPTSLVGMAGIVCVALLPTRADAEIGELDHLLNCPHIGARTLTRDETRTAATARDHAIGQTFRTGPAAEEIFRIAVYQQFWHESWQPDENLVLTLWDSPSRKISSGRDSIPYERHMWEGSLPMFTLGARVEKNRSYYFELTVELSPPKPAEVPRDWLLSGKRPGFAGGDGVIGAIGVAQDHYADGQACVAGQAQDYDLLFQVHERPPLDRNALYSEVFSRFDLDYPPLAQLHKAVEARDWDGAVQEMIRHFEARSDLIDPLRRTPAFKPQYDTREADLAAQHRVMLDDRNTTIDLGPTWNHFQWYPERGGVGLTRGGLRKPLSEGYENTGNPKYASAFDDMLRHMAAHLPSPLRSGMYTKEEVIRSDLPPGLGGGSMWSALSIGARMIHGFHYYATFVDSPFFRPDTRAEFIINLGEMADVLERMKGGGNWATQMASALFQFGQKYPEFKNSQKWLKKGFDGLVENALQIVRPDGVLNEPTSNYHNLVLNRYSAAMVRARELGLKVPDAMARLVEKMFDFTLYSTLPDGTLPVWGDTFYPTRPELLPRGSELFHRPDMLFVATGGKEGVAPKQTSYGFSDGGFYYMRSGWSRDADYMAIRCGPYGSHGHADTLSVLVSAFGTDVLIDPGVLTYGSREARELKATRSHNTVTVDDRDAHPGKTLAWTPSAHFDFFAGRGAGYRDLATAQLRRRVWFIKPFERQPGAWIIFDDIAGNEKLSASLRYRFAALPVQTDSKSSVWSSGADGNLLICVLETPGSTVRLTKGIADRHGMTEVPLAVFEEPTLPAQFTSVLLPFKGSQPPAYEARRLDVQGAAQNGRAVWIARGNTAIVVVMNGDGTLSDAAELQTTLPDSRTLRVSGAGAAVRFSKHADSWVPTLLQGVSIKSISLQGARLFGTKDILPVVDQTIEKH